MRIVHVITRLIFGGAQENTLLTVDELHHRYHDDVTLITGPAEGPEGDLFDRRPVRNSRSRSCPSWSAPIRPVVDVRAYRRLRAAFRRSKPEVVHTHSSKAGILGRAAAWHEHVPAVVHTIHGMPFGPFETPLKNRLYITLERWAARRCHAIVSVCDAMTSQALAAGVGRPDQFLTVYSGMDADAFPQSSAARAKKFGASWGWPTTTSPLPRSRGCSSSRGTTTSSPSPPTCWQPIPRSGSSGLAMGSCANRLIADLERLGIRGSFILTGLVSPGRIPESAQCRRRGDPSQPAGGIGSSAARRRSWSAAR